jgi:hypothetical protein
MSQIEFRDPPPAKRGRADYDDVIAALRQRPGTWAACLVLLGGDRTGAVSAKSSLERRGAEATTRVEDGSMVVYARWPEASK